MAESMIPVAEFDRAIAREVELQREVTRLRAERDTWQAESQRGCWPTDAHVEIDNLRNALAGNGLAVARLEAVLAKQLDELTRLRALLASGQCVDLARVDDEGLGCAAEDSVRAEAQVYEGYSGASLRAWLIEKAGVKA